MNDEDDDNRLCVRREWIARKDDSMNDDDDDNRL